VSAGPFAVLPTQDSWCPKGPEGVLE